MLAFVVAFIGMMMCLPMQGCGGKNFTAPELATDLLSSPTMVAEALIGNTITESEMDSLLRKPANFHLEVAKAIAMKQGKTSAEADALVAELANSEPVASALKIGASPMAIAGCNQTIEYKTVVRDPVWAYTYRSYDSSRGKEYLFYYNPWWTVSADNIRWASIDGQVTWALFFCYGGNLAGSNLCSKPFQFMTGNTGVWMAGGVGRIYSSMYAHHI